jgi:hypothetical protein
MFLGALLAVIARNQGDHFHFLRGEPAQVAVLDDVVGMLGVLLVSDAGAHIVNERGIMQEPSRVFVQTMFTDQVVVKGERQIADMAGMDRIATESIEQPHHAAKTQIRHRIHRGDLARVRGDVVGQEALPDSKVGHRDRI